LVTPPYCQDRDYERFKGSRNRLVLQLFSRKELRLQSGGHLPHIYRGGGSRFVAHPVTERGLHVTVHGSSPLDVRLTNTYL
jgi:hypothetical protein